MTKSNQPDFSPELSELHAFLAAKSAYFLKECFPEETTEFTVRYLMHHHPTALPTRKTARELPFGLGDTYTYVEKMKQEEREYQQGKSKKCKQEKRR